MAAAGIAAVPKGPELEGASKGEAPVASSALPENMARGFTIDAATETTGAAATTGADAVTMAIWTRSSLEFDAALKTFVAAGGTSKSNDASDPNSGRSNS